MDKKIHKKMNELQTSLFFVTSIVSVTSSTVGKDETACCKLFSQDLRILRALSIALRDIKHNIITIVIIKKSLTC